jgi:hypothetical protein
LPSGGPTLSGKSRAEQSKLQYPAGLYDKEDGKNETEAKKEKQTINASNTMIRYMSIDKRVEILKIE